MLRNVWKDTSAATPYQGELMKLTTRAPHLNLSPEVRDRTHRRLYVALGRLATTVRALDVTIVDINGPKGGADKQCRIQVRRPSLRGISIEHEGTDVLASVSLAAERTGRAIARARVPRRTFTSLHAS
jgi:putative sigma-54 modulation protein